jgi:hypothetical protein
MYTNLFTGNLIDPFVFIHLLSGIYLSIFFELFITKDNNKIFLYGSITHLLYEIKDFLNTYIFKANNIILLDNFKNYKSSRNTLLNSIGDQIFYTLGYYIYDKIKKVYQFKKIDLILIFIIKMLLYIQFLSIFNKN